jgi:hypothetical protein
MSCGKVGILFLDFHFPMAVAGRSCGNVEIAHAISKGGGQRRENLHLVFLAVHHPSFPQLLRTSRNFSFPDAGEQFLLCLLHRDRRVGVALLASQPVEFFDRNIFLKKSGQSR